MEGFWINRKRLGIFLGVSVTLLVIVVVISLNTFLHQPQAQDASRNLDNKTLRISNKTVLRTKMDTANSDGSDGIIFDNIVFPDRNSNLGHEDIKPTVLPASKNILVLIHEIGHIEKNEPRNGNFFNCLKSFQIH